VTVPTIPIMMEGPIPIMVAATVTSMRQALVVDSPPTRVVLARMLNHRQVPVVNVVDRMEPALGIIALRILVPPLCMSAILM
jgi:hypothetical protein